MFKFTFRAENVIKISNEIAQELGHSYIGTEHILYGLVKEGVGATSRLLKNQEVTFEKVEDKIRKIIGAKKPNTSILGFTLRTKKVLENAFIETKKDGLNSIGTEHILLGIIKENDCLAVRILMELNVNIQNLFDEIIKISNRDEKIQESEEGSYATPTLNQFGDDLTKKAKEGKLDPVIGRKEEIERVIQILSRRIKNNPCLVGKPGVGKTAVIEGIAQKIVKLDIPENLRNKRIVTLDISGMVAGAKYRGDFEERLKKAINEAKKSTDVILFIDEVHTIVGAGAAEGAIDAANILKPILARGEIQLIGATTFSEYTKYIEKDPALERRFSLVTVEEPSKKETIEILKGIRHKYEEHHNVKITDKVIEMAVNMSSRYISDRFLPDKAIDLIDETASKVKIKTYENSNIIKKIQEENIAEVIATWTGIPACRLAEDENKKLKNLEAKLHERVIGQNEAIEVVSKAIRRGRIGLKDINRPIGSFLFLGPTGVGKTELAKSLAENLFENENSIIRIDMSEYMELHSVAKLIGSPPGYIGFDEGGQLTEKVKRKPYSVVLFDEIEKAHPDVMNILLQILEDGRLTDSQGRTIDFKNTIIIMTSNIGARMITDKKTLGFAKEKDESYEKEYQETKKDVMDLLKKELKPEFINRIDEVIVFHKLNDEEINQIIDIRLNEIINRMKKQKIIINIEPSVRNFIFSRKIDRSFGARPLRRIIQKLVEDKIVEEILDGNIVENKVVNLSANEGKIVLR
jgi:ATP-dependent Clp protease ATP-binding subunit ClpC